MTKFLKAVDKNRFDSFVSAHPKAHFMQSAAWGEFCSLERGMKPHCVGLEQDGKLIAAALLLERRPKFFPPYFYSPRGFTVDFFDKSLLGSFTREISAYCKEQGAMFLKIDPDVELREISVSGAPVEDGFDNGELIESLGALGFRHLGFNKGFERRQPRYTFRIDLLPDVSALTGRIEGNVLKNVRKGEKNYAAEIVSGTGGDVKELFRLISETGERDGFFAYSERFYQRFYDTLSKYGMAELYLGIAYPGRSAEGLKKQLDELLEKKKGYKKEQKIREAEESEKRIRKEISAFEGYAEKYGESAVISAHLVVRYGARAWAVHAGSSKDMAETFLNNRIYLHKILDQKAKGAVWLDQFGTVGNPNDSPLKSLHEFKRQFGGRYMEFAGEFDMVFRPFWYGLYTKMLPRYRALLFDVRGLLRKLSRKK